MGGAPSASVPPKPPGGEGYARDFPSQAPPLLLGVGGVCGMAEVEWTGL